MTPDTRYFKLGIFVIAACALLTIFLIIFGAGKMFKKELLAETCFNESVQGLNIGSEVKYKGIQIGTVKAISSAAQIYQTKSDYVLVTIDLEQDISLGQTGKTAKERMEKAIKDGLSIRLSFKGLTGAAYLETDYAPIPAEDQLNISWTPEHMYIPSRQSNMKQFGDSLNQILENLTAINLKGMTVDLESLLKTLNKKAQDVNVKQISEQISALLIELNQTSKRISTAMGSPKIKQLIEDVQVSFTDFRTIVEQAKDPLDKAFTDFKAAAGSTKNMTASLENRLAPRIDSLSTNLDKLMKSLSATSDLLENIVWLNSDKIELIIENLETTSENLKQMSKDLKRYPGRLLFEKPPSKITPEKDTHVHQ
jgi:ABC-type transporter Mla subunit MlaD